MDYGRYIFIQNPHYRAYDDENALVASTTSATVSCGIIQDWAIGFNKYNKRNWKCVIRYAEKQIEGPIWGKQKF